MSAVDVGYDAALRVTSEAYSDDGEPIRYGYDADSNRTSRVTSARSETYAYLAGALLAAVTMASAPTEVFAYDSAGRAIEVRGAAVSWDADDHVTALDARSWSFDAQGRRTRVDGVEHLVAATLDESLASPWLVMDAGGAARVGYVYSGEHPLARYDATTGARVYYLADAMGSVIGLVGDDHTNRATIQYDGFGNVRRTGGSAALAALPSATGGDFRFQGMWSDAVTGLYYVRARVYDAQTGRFLSRDPAEGSLRQPETLIPYSFGRNNSLVWRDATGETSFMEVSAGTAGSLEVQLSASASAALRTYQMIRSVALVLGTAVVVDPTAPRGPNRFVVRLQAQGGGLEASFPYNGTVPMTVNAGLAGLVVLDQSLSRSERRDRASAFAQAAKWIRSRPPTGARPPGKSGFHNRGISGSDARVDVEILLGTNFVL